MQLTLSDGSNIILTHGPRLGVSDIVLNMIKILFLQKIEILFGVVYLFAIFKHQDGSANAPNMGFLSFYFTEMRPFKST